ncbi:hypothetical protein EB796_016788 [Bugula neritina]|uniref:Uncharacterized protein n=1 Tax=Bugula neritina TaxID=10212 RepID=A0A7J7JFK2_BUGNE|nr:hypothetical protein EB796_016788 [Bugula neritina]
MCPSLFNCSNLVLLARYGKHEEMTSCNKADSRLSPNSLPSKRKAKNRIYKTYYHDIYVTYNKLTSSEDLNSEDSDPDETQLMLSSLVLNTDSAASTTSEQHTDCRGAPTKQSIGGLSTVDSGVVSHDSLLDRYREMSAPRSECSESPSSKYSTLDTTQRGRGLGMAEFDPLNPPVLLDSKLRSQSRTRLEEHQTRGKSPCRSHGVKQIINFFEGSQEDLASRTQQRITGSTGHLTRTPSGAQSTSGSTDNLHHGNSTYSTKQYSSKPPPIKQPLYTSPIRLARKSRAKSKPELHGVIVIESVRRVNHLTCHKLTLSSRIFCLA